MMTSKEREIWQDYIDGKEGAFECLYLAFVDRLYQYGCRICDDSALVEDGIQDTFLKIYRKKKGLRKIQNIRSYLFVSLRNYLHSHRRKALRRLRRDLQFAESLEARRDPQSDSRPRQASLRANLKQEIDRLPDRQREILYLKYFEGLDYEEIGEVMGISYQVARNYLYRAIRQLRGRLADKPKAFQRWLAS